MFGTGNRVEVLLQATDRITPVLRDVRKSFDWFGKNGKLGDFEGLGRNIGVATKQSSLFWATFSANAALMAVGAVSNAFSNLGQTIQDTAKIQTSMLADAGTLSAVTGLSLNQSKKVIGNVSDKLSVSAGSLPGESNDYIQIASSISRTLGRQYDLKTDTGLKDFETTLIKIAEGATFLGQTKGVENTNTAMFVNRFLSGESFSTLKNVLQFGENTGIMEDVGVQLQQQGLTTEQFEGLDAKTKLSMLSQALGRIVSPELIAEVTGTADAIMASMRDRLFSPQTGLFGLLRKVDTQLSGNRSVMDSFTEFLVSFNALGADIGKLAAKLGLNFDPLEPLIFVIDSLNNLTQDAQGFIRNFSGKTFKDLKLPSFQLPDFGRAIALGLNSLISGVFKVGVKLDGGSLGRFFSTLFNGVSHNLNTLLAKTDWHKLGQSLGVGLVKIASVFLNLLSTLDYGSVFTTILRLGVSAIKFIFGLVHGIAAATFQGLVSWANSRLQPIKDFFSWVANSFNGLLTTFTGTLNRIGVALDTIGNAIISTVTGIKTKIDNLIPDLPQISLPSVSLPQTSLPSISLPPLPQLPKLNPVNPLAPQNDSVKPLVSNQASLPLLNPLTALTPTIKPLTDSSKPTNQNTVTISPVINLANNPTNPQELAGLVVDKISAMWSDSNATILVT